MNTKEELAWAIDIWLQVISNKLFKIAILRGDYPVHYPTILLGPY